MHLVSSTYWYEVADFLAKRGAGGVSSMERPPQAFLQSVNFDDAVT